MPTDADLDIVVEMCNPHEDVKALDVATGGGHVARRLREQGAEVVTARPGAGHAGRTSLCRAEDLPFADGSFDVVVTRIAPHHFADIGKAVGEMARVVEPRRRRRGHAVHLGGGRGGREAARPDARAQLLRGGVARAARERRPRDRARRARSRRRTTSTPGSRAPAARARTPSACASCSRRGHRPRTATTWHDTKLIVKARKSQK